MDRASVPEMRPAKEQKTGSLIIVGSGLRSIGQITLETIMHIEAADKVFYLVTDPTTEGFILGKNKNCVDLYQYYSNTKQRMETYVQMAEVMLQAVRDGLKVVGIFYGHPGVFTLPSRRAIEIARSEGYSAQMLPGISAEDCLFADLLVDPSFAGAQSVEATDLLLKERPLLTTSHVIIWQVGCVGRSDFNFSGFNNNKFDKLVDRLMEDYGANHPVISYMASVSPLSEPIIKRYTIEDLYKAEVQATITGATTFYLPPKTLLPITPAGEKFMFGDDKNLKLAGNVAPIYPPFPFNESLTPVLPPYGPEEMKVIAALKHHTMPVGYRPYVASPAMQKAVERLSLSINTIKEYQASPSTFAASIQGLDRHETQALASGNAHRIDAAMRGTIDWDPNAVHPTAAPAVAAAPLVVEVVVVLIGARHAIQGDDENVKVPALEVA